MNLEKNRIIYLIVIGMVLILVSVSGCIGGSGTSTIANSPSAVTQTNIQSAVTTTLPQDKIIGIWELGTGPSMCEHTFASDYSYDLTCSGTSGASFGTWTNVGENKYVASFTGSAQKISYEYHPETDTITQSLYPTVPLYRPGKQHSATIAQVSTGNNDVGIVSKKQDYTSYGDVEVTGIIKNNLNMPLTAWVTVDLYDKNKVKLGTGYDIVSLDASGQSKFDIVVFGSDKYADEFATYRTYIDHTY